MLNKKICIECIRLWAERVEPDGFWDAYDDDLWDDGVVDCHRTEHDPNGDTSKILVNAPPPTYCLHILEHAIAESQSVPTDS